MAERPGPIAEPTVEESFRASLQDALAILKKLAPHCGTVDELVGMAELALENDGQLRMLLKEVAPIQLRR